MVVLLVACVELGFYEGWLFCWLPVSSWGSMRDGCLLVACVELGFYEGWLFVGCLCGVGVL